MGVVAIRVLSAGLLAGKRSDSSLPTLSAGSDTDSELRRISELKRRLSLSTDEELYNLALRFVLTHDDVDCFPIGFSNPDHIDRAVRALEMGPLEPKEYSEIVKAYATPPFKEKRT
jgi:aryl-alcohol dehydrogenase-like predicted oxidoreductase